MGDGTVMSYYTDEQIKDYENNLREWLRRSEQLTDTAISYSFKNPSTEEYLKQGFVRRLQYLEHAMYRLADIYPPNSVKASRDTIRDAELLLQSYVMNVFGAIDNLAWVWALERGVTRPNGKKLAPMEIVFNGPKAKVLLASLTPSLTVVINDAEKWFKALRAYRDGVAHQIPIYIPRLLNKKQLKKAAELKVAIDDAILACDYKLMSELMDISHQLGDYGPQMALNGQQIRMYIHPQMVCDLATVVNLGEVMFSELVKSSTLK